MSTDDRTFGRRKNRFTERQKKGTQKTIPWKIVGRGGEPKWARDGRCRRKAGRLGTGELGLKGRLWLCRRARVKGQWWIGCGQWGESEKAGSDGRRRLSRW